MPSPIHIPAAQVGDRLSERGSRPGADVLPADVRALDLAEVGGARAGVWECTSGGWAIEDRPDTELCLILAGSATITDGATGAVLTVEAGDVLVLPEGWSGRWDIDGSVRKMFVTLRKES